MSSAGGRVSGVLKIVKVALLSIAIVACGSTIASNASGAANAKPKRATSVTIHGSIEGFTGRVKSAKTCERFRQVKLYEAPKGGGDVVLVDIQKAADNGSYFFDVFPYFSSQYFVEAPRTATARAICKPGISPAIGGAG